MQVLWDLTEECFWEILRISGVHTGKTKILSGASGHAVIQVDKNGQNNIIICGEQMMLSQWA